MRLRSLFIVVVLIVSLAATFPHPALAQVQVIETHADSSFGENITFYARLHSDVPIEKAVIFFGAENDTHTGVGQTEVNSLDAPTTVLTYTHNLSDYAFRLFSNIEYHFEVTLQDGNIYNSPAYNFNYIDNRFDWQTLDEKPFRVHWYEGDITFAQNILDVAQEGLKRLQNLLLLPAPDSLDIYVYADTRSMQAVLNPAGANWVAGHADPDLGVIIVTLPPGPDQRMLTEQRIPHELTHTALYQAHSLGYADIPTWLNEGLASQAELYPNPDYGIVLENAVKKDTLLPMSALCKTFPRDASSALLSYAQAASFTRYLHDKYGTSGLQSLVTAYSNGIDCEQGAKTALGVGLTQLDHQWRRDALAQNVALTALINLLPWLVLLVAALAVPLILIVRATIRVRKLK